MKVTRAAAAVSAMTLFFLACGTDEIGTIPNLAGLPDGGGGTPPPNGTGTNPPVNNRPPDAGSDSGGPDGGGPDACATDQPPQVTSSLADVGFPIGSGTATRTIVFGEPVTIDAEGIVIDQGGTIVVTPPLPATASSFTVVASGLADGTDYTVTTVAQKTRDACGNAPTADTASKFVSGCAADVTGPLMTSGASLPLAPGATTLEYDLVFDETVNLAAGGIGVSGGATLSVTPALPAAASSFHVSLSGLSAAQNYDLTVSASSVADRCGNPLAANATIAIAGQCVGDVKAPAITSDMSARRFPGGTFSHTITFDEPVTIAAGGISVSNGATITTTPALPATSSTFVVDLGGLVDGTTYVLTASAASIADLCGRPAAIDRTMTLTGCAGDASPPIRVSPATTGLCGPSHDYTLTFDEPVTLTADALVVSGGGTVASVSPPLPARAASFVVSLGNLGGSHTLSVATGKATDDCSNATTAPITVDTGGTATFEFTGAIVSFTLPSCAATIEAWGAQGGNNGTSAGPSGLGARMRGDFANLTEIKVLVGEQPSNNAGNGGGGGTFVVNAADDAPLVIAGGGGGSGDASASYKDGWTETSGQTCSDGGGSGGVDGSGGGVGPAGFQSGAGGGLLTSGANGWTANSGGASFLLGGAGGSANNLARGGFGGGGSGSSYVVGGGGGGYSGGGTCSNASGLGRTGAGGGSFNAGTNQSNASGVRTGHGRVVITYR